MRTMQICSVHSDFFVVGAWVLVVDVVVRVRVRVLGPRHPSPVRQQRQQHLDR